MSHESLIEKLEAAFVRILDETDAGTIHAIAMQAFDSIPESRTPDRSLVDALKAKKHTPDQGIDAEMAAYNSGLDDAIALANHFAESKAE